MIKKIIIFGAIFLITFSICSFIHFSNDHKECRNEINSKLNSKGNLVKEDVHICKEKYNF
jgi:hypothetical protein